MDRWLNVNIPPLPPLNVAPRLGGVVLPPDVTLYVCGITPYDATHLGHAQTYLAFDHLVRLLRATGHGIRHVQNVTDVDEPLLERAAQVGVDWRALAAGENARFFDDMEVLRVVAPDHYVGAIESIPLVVDAVGRLLASGAAYRLAAPGVAGTDVYADTATDAAFRTTLPADDPVSDFAENGGDPEREGKRDPLDPLLWRAERPGEPAWEGGALGRGRPGWHIECAAIATEYLGGAPTITGGGRDLVFPHHHMTASHLRGLGRGDGLLAMHVGMVGLDGHKMSKSRGNLEFVSRLREAGADPLAIRLALAAHHWRTDWEWHSSDLDAAEARLARWRGAARTAGGAPGGPAPSGTSGLAGSLARALADELDVPAAISAVDGWAERVRSGDAVARGDLHALDAVDAFLGVDLRR